MIQTCCPPFGLTCYHIRWRLPNLWRMLAASLALNKRSSVSTLNASRLPCSDDLTPTPVVLRGSHSLSLFHSDGKLKVNHDSEAANKSRLERTVFWTWWRYIACTRFAALTGPSARIDALSFSCLILHSARWWFILEQIFNVVLVFWNEADTRSASDVQWAGACTYIFAHVLIQSHFPAAVYI